MPVWINRKVTRMVQHLVCAFEVEVRSLSGHTVRTLFSQTPVMSGEGDVESVVVTLHDMRPLEELERLRSEFVVKASTTTVLNNYAPLDQTEVVQLHRMIDAETDRMRELIRDLLDVPRIESGTLAVNLELTELPAQPPLFLADARRIARTLTNQLSNAAKSSPAATVIRIATVVS